MLGHELVDVGSDGLVEGILIAVECERDGLDVPIGEQSPAVEILEVFLEPAKCPGRIIPKAKDIIANLAGLLAKPATTARSLSAGPTIARTLMRSAIGGLPSGSMES